MPSSDTNIVDRNVLQIIPQSRIKSCSNYSSRIEFLHRINGTSIIFQAATLLRLSPSVYATTTTIFHRFYHRESCSLEKFDVWSIAIASLLLACKVEEDVRRIREIILVFIHVYRRMRLGLGSASTGTNDMEVIPKTPESLSIAQAGILKENHLSEEERQNILRYVRPLPQYGMLYKEWEEQVMDMENIILRELGFVLYWIPDSHPHTFLLYFIKVLGVEEKCVAQFAWNYCNDSCRLDICVRYSPELVACAAIHLACIDSDISLPLTPKPWWSAFLGQEKGEDLSSICNAILALGDNDCVEGYADASTKYLISLVDGGSFCDPGSFIWNAMD
jgi:hypothetical protein